MDNYIKDKQIGEGSFGKAFLVKNKITNILYVMKEINISRMSQKERNEARKEVEVLSQMNHPNIVSYQESFEEGGFLFIIMDYCDGGDLYSRINNQRGIYFSEEQILDWFVQLCLSLKHVHDRKILHRDIKSQNIFLTKNYVIKLGDFGIARVLNSTMDLARTCIGTPYYLSPEICENKPYNNKSDIWSLGCVLYELVTLKHAFEAGNMKNLVLKIIRGSYPPVPARYSYDLRNLITQLFKRNPKDRPSINNILKKPFIKKYAVKFISESQLTSLDSAHKNRNPINKVVGQQKKLERITKPAAKYGISVANRRQSMLEEKKRKAAYISEKANELAMLKKNILERQRKEKQDKMSKVERNCIFQKDDVVLQNADAPFNERGNYDFYHAMLDKIDLRQDQKKENLRPANDPIYISNENKVYFQQQEAGKDGRAMLVEDFLRRKHDAEMNKAKVAYDMGVKVTPKVPPLFAYENKNISESNKISSEEEYLARLKAIRIQNMYEQRVLKDKMVANFKGIKFDVGPEGDCNTYIPTGIQHNRVDLLKYRVARIKAKIEEKRQESYEKERLQWKEHMEVKVQKSETEFNTNNIPIRECGEVLVKKIEENNVQLNVEETKYKQELNIDNLKPERSRWQAANHVVLNEFPLEQTRSEMEETSVNDIVITNPSKSIITGDRHHWDVPTNSVVEELENVQVGSSTVILTSEFSIQPPVISEVNPSSNSNIGTSNDQDHLVLNDKNLVEEICMPLDEQNVADISDKFLATSKSVFSISADLNDNHGCHQEPEKYEANTSIVVNKLKKNEDDNFLLSMLCSGTYDTNARNLRTCSMPDLSKLGIDLHEEDQLIVDKEVVSKEKTNLEIIKPDDKIDYSPDFDDDDDDDMATLRRSMADLLVEENDKKETADEEENDAVSDDASSETSGSLSPNEEWHSDNSSEEDTMCNNGKFTQLEFCRLQLEEELGLTKFLEAYRAVQAIHEDEDDSMVDGICIMNNILGENKEFLYSKILQLVMADGAFTEDNE